MIKLAASHKYKYTHFKDKWKFGDKFVKVLAYCLHVVSKPSICLQLADNWKWAIKPVFMDMWTFYA